MSQSYESNAMEYDAAGDEMDLREFVVALWKRKYLIAVVVLVCCVLAFASSYLFKRKYEADLVFVTVTDDAMGDRGGGLGSLASQFGGLAALGGLSLSGNERKEEYLAVLESQALVGNFINKNNLMPILYASAWDASSKAWKEVDTKKRPTLWKATQYFKSRIMHVKTDAKSGISTLSITWSDPDVGTSWANGLLRMANDRIRERTIEESQRNVAYLNEQLAKTSVVAVQNSISTLLENQIKRIMLAQGTDQYAFRVIDPAVPPEIASFPNRIMWAFVGCVIGLLISIAFVISGRAMSIFGQRVERA